MVVNEHVKAVLRKEMHYPAKSLIGTVAGKVVIAGVCTVSLRRGLQLWDAVIQSLLSAAWCHRIGQNCFCRLLPMAGPIPGWKAV